MRQFRFALAALLCLGLSAALAAEGMKSGPQPGQTVPGPFHPLNINGPSAGEKSCLYCRNGTNPVAMVFAREVNEPLTQLIKKLDAAVEQNKDSKMGSFVVFLGDSQDMEPKLKELADREKLQHVVLSIDNPAGPEEYKVARQADVTVVLYTNHKVKSNYAFARGELKDKDIDTILADLPKILKD
jgi:hypothetical protein